MGMGGKLTLSFTKSIPLRNGTYVCKIVPQSSKLVTNDDEENKKKIPRTDIIVRNEICLFKTRTHKWLSVNQLKLHCYDHQ